MPSLLINKKALIDNYNFLQKQSGNAPLHPVMKGNAYGLGADIIAPILYQHGARFFFTAHLEEALELKQHPQLYEARFGVFNGFMQGTAKDYVNHQITPIFNSTLQIQQWLDEIKDTPHQTFLHMDSGMNRLGIPYDEALILCHQNDFLPLLKKANITHILSHFLTSDNPLSPHNQAQLEKLKNIQSLLHLPLIVANSAGIMLGKDYHFSGTKPGAALYGIYRDMFPQLKHVIDLEAPILQINTLKKGETSGYDATFIAPHNMLTATIECGYADGYLRYGENNTQHGQRHVLINGKKAPLIGRVSMDVIIVDITAIIKETSVEIGQMAKLIWQDYDINAIARDTGTIPHEFLTFFSKRVKRVIVEP